MTYRISVRPAARRELARLPQQAQQRIEAQLDELAEDPRPHGAKMLSGRPGLYRVRVGNYRIIYRVEDDKVTVLVLAIGHRKDIYRT